MMKGCVMKSMKKSVLLGLPLLCALSLSSAIAVGGMSAAAADDAAGTSALAETVDFSNLPQQMGESNFDYVAGTNMEYKIMIGHFKESAENYGLTAFDTAGVDDSDRPYVSNTAISGLTVSNWKWTFAQNTSVVLIIRAKVSGMLDIDLSTISANDSWMDAWNLIYTVHQYHDDTKSLETLVNYYHEVDSVSNNKLTTEQTEMGSTYALSVRMEQNDVLYYELGCLDGRNLASFIGAKFSLAPINDENAAEYYAGLLDEYVASLTRANYTDESWKEIEDRVTAFKSGSYTSAVEAKAAYDVAVADIADIAPDSKEYLSAQLDMLVATLSQADYETETWAAIQGYVTAFKEGEYANAAAIKTAYDAAVAAINGTEPDSLTWLRADLLSKMNAYYNAQTESYYTPQDWATLKKAHDDYVANYESYASKEELQAYFDTQYAAMTAPQAYIQSITYLDLHTAVYKNNYGWVEGPVADITMLTGSVQHDTLVAFDTYQTTSSADTLTNSELYADYNGAYAQNWKWYVGMNIGVTVAYRANQDCSLTIGASEGKEINDAGWTEVCTINEYIVRNGETKLIRTTPLNDQPTDEVFFGTWYLKEGDILYIEFISNASDARNTESPFVLEATLDATKFDEDAYAEQNHDLPAEVVAHIEEKLAELNAYLATLNEEDYSATNWLLLSDYIAQFEADCEMEVFTIEDVDALYLETRTAMENVPTREETLAQLKETLDQYVEELRAEYNALLEQYRYSDEAKAELDAALEEGIENIYDASSAAAGNTAKSRALTALRAVEGSPKGLGTGAIIGIVAACVVVAAGAVTAAILITKKKKAKKDGE